MDYLLDIALSGSSKILGASSSNIEGALADFFSPAFFFVFVFLVAFSLGLSLIMESTYKNTCQ